jgi:putative FmdB family regulatory protein
LEFIPTGHILQTGSVCVRYCSLFFSTGPGRAESFSAGSGKTESLELSISELSLSGLSLLGVIKMPIYEYECKACGHRMEKLQKISADPLKDCPACQSDGLERLVSAAGFRLAGGGWYETDFKTGSKKNLVADGKTASADAGKSSDSSATAKSATPKDKGAAA